MIVAGIDYSMTSPSIAILNTEDEIKFENIKIFSLYGVKKYIGVHGKNIRIDLFPEWNTPEERFSDIANWAEKILDANKVCEVVLEGYALGSTKGLVFQIAENTSVLKQRLHKMSIPFTIPSPSSVKKNFTGKGNAKKPEMVDAFDKRFGVDISKIIGCVKAKAPENDMVDSVANLLMHKALK